MLNEEKPGIIPVGELLLFLKGFLQKEAFFHSLTIKGEIGKLSEWKGAIFFDLKDEKGFLSCSWWQSSYHKPSYLPKTGDEVLVTGDLTLYEKRGSLSFRVSTVTPFGEGAKLLAIKKLKEKLAQEGLFSLERKKEIPHNARDIGICCGQNSAAESDIRRNLFRRSPLCKMTFHYATVQGKNAAKEIISSLKQLDEEHHEVILLARGGGSDEDLMAFNDEELARTIAELKTPLVAAIGHEIDVTIADLVSDLRVSTPTAAAEAVTYDIQDLFLEVEDLHTRFFACINTYLNHKNAVLNLYLTRPIFVNPLGIFLPLKERFDAMKIRFTLANKKLYEDKLHQVKNIESKLSALSPESVLDRGYSLTLNENGEVVKEKKDAQLGSTITIVLKKDKIKARVIGYGKEDDI